MPRVLEACRAQRTNGPLVLRPVSGKPINPRDVYRMVTRIAKTAGTPRYISPHSLRYAAITKAVDAGIPLSDAQILAPLGEPDRRPPGHGGGTFPSRPFAATTCAHLSWTIW